MHPILRNILAVIAGYILGSLVNLGLVKLGQSIFPIEGVDPNDMEAMALVLPTLDTKYFIFPFLAHAVGTLVGAAVAAWIAVSHKMKFAMAIGFLFLVGGIMMVILYFPEPLWFVVTDLVLAYIPMAWIGGKFVTRNTSEIKMDH